MKYVFPIVLITAAVPSIAGGCLSYKGQVTLRGILSKQTFPEQPSYDSIAKGDRPATYFFVSPTKPICVAAGDPEKYEDTEAKVTIVQLVFPYNVNGYAPLRPYLGKQVICRGTLFHAVSGHHHSSVLLGEARCHAA